MRLELPALGWPGAPPEALLERLAVEARSLLRLGCREPSSASSYPPGGRSADDTALIQESANWPACAFAAMNSSTACSNLSSDASGSAAFAWLLLGSVSGLRRLDRNILGTACAVGSLPFGSLVELSSDGPSAC